MPRGGGKRGEKPKFVSRSDPAAQWTGAMKGHAFFAYATNYLIDMEHAVIVEVEASRAIRQAEVGAARTMIDRAQDRFGLYPERLAADSAYGSAEMLGWLVHERGIEPHIPVFDKSERRDGTFERAEFNYDRKRDLYTCPGGKELRQYRRRFTSPRDGVDDEGFMRYRASKLDCDACALKPQCCPNTPARKILRSVHEGARDMAREYRRDRRLCHLASRAEEGRDAVCPPQAHSEAGSSATTRTKRCPRRVPPGSRRPEESPETRQVDPDANADAGVRRKTSAHDLTSVDVVGRDTADFFNDIGATVTFLACHGNDQIGPDSNDGVRCSSHLSGTGCFSYFLQSA